MLLALTLLVRHWQRLPSLLMERRKLVRDWLYRRCTLLLLLPGLLLLLLLLLPVLLLCLLLLCLLLLCLLLLCLLLLMPLRLLLLLCALLCVLLLLPLLLLLELLLRVLRLRRCGCVLPLWLLVPLRGWVLLLASPLLLLHRRCLPLRCCVLRLLLIHLLLLRRRLRLERHCGCSRRQIPHNLCRYGVNIVRRLACSLLNALPHTLQSATSYVVSIDVICLFYWVISFFPSSETDSFARLLTGMSSSRWARK